MTRIIPTDQQAVATAMRFLRAFKNRDKATELSLESSALHARNLHQFVAQMLGVQNVPERIALVRAHTYRARSGKWTRVVARLRFRHGSVVDVLGVIKTGAGYRVNTISHVSSA